jgi:hypothetical protein
MAHVYAHAAPALHRERSVPWELQAETDTFIVTEKNHQQLRDRKPALDICCLGIEIDDRVLIALVLDAIAVRYHLRHPVPTDALVEVVGYETRIASIYDGVHIPMATF